VDTLGARAISSVWFSAIRCDSTGTKLSEVEPLFWLHDTSEFA
jgi:hypothetical protein